MENTESIFSLFASFVVYIFGFLFLRGFKFSFQTTSVRIFALYTWHTLFCIIYFFYSKHNISDSTLYYDESLLDDINLALGTDFITFFASLFTKKLDFSYLNVFMIFNIIGSLGLVAFDSSIKYALQKNKISLKIFLISSMAFLPSISFWSSALGKDAISFLAICLALWASLSLERRWILMIFSTFLMFLVRPHISGIMILALAFVIFFAHNEFSGFKKIIIAASLLIGSFFAVPFALEYSGLGSDFTVQLANDYFETRQGYNQDGGGGIDISQMSLPAQLFTYIFRPLPFEAHGFAALAASFENILLMIFFIYSFKCLFTRGRNRKFDFSNITFMICYAVITWIILAMTTANLGISLRQKWMFLPMLLYVGVFVIAAVNPTRFKIN